MSDDTKLLKYFGPVTNGDPEMMYHMVGRHLHGEPGTLKGYDLCIQKIHQIRNIIPKTSPLTRSPQEIIRAQFGDSFELYVLRPNPKGEVPGTIWDVTPQEMELIREWEMVDYGMQEQIKVTALDSQGNPVEVEIQVLLDEPHEIDRVVNAEIADLYIAPKEKMWAVADWCREEYFKAKNKTS